MAHMGRTKSGTHIPVDVSNAQPIGKGPKSLMHQLVGHQRSPFELLFRCNSHTWPTKSRRQKSIYMASEGDDKTKRGECAIYFRRTVLSVSRARFGIVVLGLHFGPRCLPCQVSAKEQLDRLPQGCSLLFEAWHRSDIAGMLSGKIIGIAEEKGVQQIASEGCLPESCQDCTQKAKFIYCVTSNLRTNVQTTRLQKSS